MKRSSRVEWFYQAKWGLFIHFLAESPGGNGSNWGDVSIESWNRKVDACDVEKLAAQLNELKVGYCFLTLGQNSGYICTPNATYDRLAGRDSKTSRCSLRDLVTDLYQALKKYDIPLMVYAPSHAPLPDAEVAIALKCVPPWACMWSLPSVQKALEPFRDSDPRIRTFQRHWEAILREWSLRWGDNVHGWWFDGCYHADKLYNFSDEPNFSSFAAAVRAGNPDSLIAWNPGVVYPPEVISSEEDYTSGETNEPDQTQCLGRWVGQAQFHVLSYLGETWGDPNIRFSATELAQVTRNITDHGGVVTWDAPFNHADGSITQEAFTVLSEFSRKMQGPRRSVRAQVPLVWGKTISNVQGSGDTERAEVEVSNPHDVPIRGQVEFRLAPANVFQPIPALDFALAPGEKGRHVFSVHPSSYASVTAVCEGVEQHLRFPGPCGIRAPRLEQRYPVYAPGGTLLAEIGFCLSDDRQLVIRGTVYDVHAQPLPIPWQGSGLEIFMMPKDNRDARLQAFITPATATRPAAVQRSFNDEFQTIPGSVIRTVAGSNGYDFDLALPLTLIATSGQTPSAVDLEMQLTVNTPQGYRRGTLFGSTNPFISTEYYVTVSR